MRSNESFPILCDILSLHTSLCLELSASGTLIVVRVHRQQEPFGWDLGCGPDTAPRAELNRAALLATKSKRLFQTSLLCQSWKSEINPFLNAFPTERRRIDQQSIDRNPGMPLNSYYYYYKAGNIAYWEREKIRKNDFDDGKLVTKSGYQLRKIGNCMKVPDVPIFPMSPRE